MAASNTRFTQNSLGQSKNPIDSDHGIYRYSAATSSRCSAARRLRGRSRRTRRLSHPWLISESALLPRPEGRLVLCGLSVSARLISSILLFAT